MTRLAITSSSNPRLKAVRRLVRPRRRSDGVFLVEGHRQLRRALEADARVREVYASPNLFLGADDAFLVADAERRGARVFELAPDAFASIARVVRCDGLAAVVERWPTRLARLRLPRSPLLVVAEGVERPGNLGTIVRTACAAAADALVVCNGRTDVFHPEVVRGSVGTVFDVQLAEAPTQVAVRWLRERGIRPTSPRPTAGAHISRPTCAAPWGSS